MKDQNTLLDFEIQESHQISQNFEGIIQQKQAMLDSFSSNFQDLCKNVIKIAERHHRKNTIGASRDDIQIDLANENQQLRNKIELLEHENSELKDALKITSEFEISSQKAKSRENEMFERLFQNLENAQQSFESKIKNGGNPRVKSLEEKLQSSTEKVQKMEDLLSEKQKTVDYLNEKIRKLEADGMNTAKKEPEEEMKIEHNSTSGKLGRNFRKSRSSFFSGKSKTRLKGVKESGVAENFSCFDCQTKIRKKRQLYVCNGCSRTWHRRCLEDKRVKKKEFYCEDCK